MTQAGKLTPQERRQFAEAAARLAAAAAKAAADIKAADRELQKHLDAASASATKALAIMAGLRKSLSLSPAALRRTLGMMAQAKGALSLLEGIGPMRPRWDAADPDLIPENQKTVLVRAKAKTAPLARGGS